MNSNRAIWKQIITLGLPSLGTVLLEPALSSTDSAIMGHLGQIPLAALALGTGILTLFAVPFTSLSFAITSKVARLKGQIEGDGKKKVGDSIGREDSHVSPSSQLITLGMISSLSLLVLGFVVGTVLALVAIPITYLLQPNAQVGRFALTYLQLACIGLPLLFFAEGAAAYLTGQGRTTTALLVSLLTVTVNVVVEVVLVFVFHLSIKGSAIGTDLAELTSATVLYFLIKSPLGTVRSTFRDVSTFLIATLSDALNLIVRTLTLVGAISGAVLLASAISVRVLDEFQGGEQIWLLFGLAFDAIAVPAQILVGQWRGSEETEKIRPWGNKLLITGLVASLVVGGAVLLLSNHLATLFTTVQGNIPSYGAAISYCGYVMPLTALSFVIDGLVGGLERFDLLRRAMALSLAGFVLIALTGIFLLRIDRGVVGVWISFGFWLAIRASLSYKYWLSSTAKIHSLT